MSEREDIRPFDELPEHIWVSPEAQLVKAINDFENENTGVLGAVARLADRRKTLPGDIRLTVYGLKLILFHGTLYKACHAKLEQAFEASDPSAVKQIIQFYGAEDDSWEINEVAKWYLLLKQQEHLNQIGGDLDAFQTMKSAMGAIVMGSAIEHGKMVLKFFDRPIPSGGLDLATDYSTPVMNILPALQN